jgi:PKD repeat protein
MSSKRFLYLWLVLAILLAGLVTPLFQPAVVVAATPATPTNLSPSDNATSENLTPTLQSSLFSDNNTLDTHAASQWQITMTAGNYSSPAFSSVTYSPNLTSTTVPVTTLGYLTIYYWHVRHQDNNLDWSEWSAETSFTTVAAPLADFSADRTEVGVGQIVTFTDNSSGGVAPLGYQWDFGDLSGSTAQNPTHSYGSPDTYTVTVTVTDSAGGTDIEEKVGYITVVAGLVADFIADRTEVGVGQTVTFTNMTSGGSALVNSYEWDFNNDGTPDSSAVNPNYAYTSVGTYTVVLTATYLFSSDTESKTGYITVVYAPVAAFSADRTAAVVGQPIIFTNASSGGAGALTYQWDFGDGQTSNEQSPTHAYSAFGTYTVKLTVTDSASNTDTEEKAGYIIVSNALVADFSADKVLAAVDQTIQFTNLSVGGAGGLTYQWDFNNDGIPDSTLQHPSYSYSAAGTYTVKLTVTDSAANTNTSTKANYITIAAGLQADFSADRATVAMGQTIQFTDLSAGGVGTLTYQWDFNNDGTWDSTDQHPSYSYSSPGTYTVVLRVTDGAANTDTEIKTNYITVTAGLVADFSADRVLVAVGQIIQFTDLTSGGVGSLNFLWDFNNDGTPDSTEQNPSHSYSSPGTYTVVLRITDGAANTDTETKTGYITIAADLLVDFSADKTAVVVGQSIQFTSNSGGGVGSLSYQWDFNNDGVRDSTEQNPTHSYSSVGTYTVVLRVTDSASNTDTEAKTGYITVYTLPQAGFSASAISVLPGGTITFTSSSTGGIPPLTYAWDFNNDGIVDSTNQKPTYSYAVAGTYTVSLKIIDLAGNSDTETRTGYIIVGNAIAPHAVPPQGGTIQTADGQITTTFPADAFSGDATLTILEMSPSAAPKAPEGYRIASSCFTLEAVNARGKAITSFSRLVTVTVKYSDEDVAAAGGDLENLVLAYYNEATGKWKIVDTTLNRTDKSLSATTTHFSTWAILVQSPSRGTALWIQIVIGIAAALAVGVVVVRAINVERMNKVP